MQQTTLTSIELKRVLTFKEACQLLGFTPSYMYKMTSAGTIPMSKPNGKKLYFDREKLEDWMLSNASCPKDKEIKASTYVATH